MAKTKPASATVALNLALPPEGGSLSVTTSLEEDAHYLHVTLDKSENFKVAAGERLRDLLINKFAGNRNTLRDWYEENVVEGKEHRSWFMVERYMGTVIKQGPEAAAALFARQEEQHRQQQRKFDKRRYSTSQLTQGENINENNGVSRQPARVIKSEYDLRKEWLSDMNHLWFKANHREWQDKWLQDRRLLRDRGSD